MSKEQKVQPDGSPPQKPTFVQKIGAAVAGMIAARVATYFVTTMWRLVTREEPPQIDMKVPLVKKALWVALVGGMSGAAAQMARDVIKPPVEGPA